MAYADFTSRSQKLPSIAAVAAVHALIGYALISGLAQNLIKDITPVFTVRSIPLDPTPPEIIQTPPPTTAETTSTQRVIVPPLPADLTPAEREPVVVSTGTIPTVTTDPIILPPPLPTQPQVSRAAGAQVQGNRASWITAEDYPSAALRAEEEGIVAISVRVGADGRVSGCTVTGSSGHAALDTATCRLYQRRARFTPARDDLGNPIEASYADRVRWELPQR